MSATEIAIYAVETRAIIHILWGLLLITSITLVSITVMHVLLRLRLRTAKRRETQFARHIATKAEDIARLEARVAEAAAVESTFEDALTELKRVEAIRAKTEQRLVRQNAEVDKLRAKLAAQGAELAHLRALVEHVGVSENDEPPSHVPAVLPADLEQRSCDLAE